MFKKVKDKRIFNKKNIVGFEVTVAGAVVVYVIILSGMIKVNSLFTGLVLVGAGVAMIFGEPVVPKYVESDKRDEVGKTIDKSSKIRRFSVFLIQQVCIAGIVLMLILSHIYDNHANTFGWIMVSFAMVLIITTIISRFIAKFSK